MSESRDHEISIAQSPAKCAYNSRHDKDVEHAVQRGDQQDRCGDIMARCGGGLAQFCDTKMHTSEPLTAIGQGRGVCALSRVRTLQHWRNAASPRKSGYIRSHF